MTSRRARRISPTALRGVDVKAAAPRQRGASKASSLDVDEHRARIVRRRCLAGGKFAMGLGTRRGRAIGVARLDSQTSRPVAGPPPIVRNGEDANRRALIEVNHVIREPLYRRSSNMQINRNPRHQNAGMG